MIDFITSYAGMIGLIFFFALFVGMTAWVYRPGARNSYQQQAHIPLNEEK